MINDEAHHAWRVPAESKIKGSTKEEIEEATKWVGDWTRIHRTRTTRHVTTFRLHLSPHGKTSSEAAQFPWIISDFGLNDAIESVSSRPPGW